MKTYRVVGSPAHIGMGAVLALSFDQVRPREHKVEVISRPRGEGDPYVVRLSAPMDFRLGEIFGMAEAPSRVQEQSLELVDEEPAPASLDRSPPKGDESRSEKPPKRPRGKGDLHAEILQASSLLDANDAESFTADGRPQVKALEAVLGYDITADERDEAWAKKQA